MEYIILWVLAIFGLWMLISKMLENLYSTNEEGIYKIIVNVKNNENTIEHLVERLSKIELISRIYIVDEGSKDSTVKIVERLAEKNAKIIYEKKITY